MSDTCSDWRLEHWCPICLAQPGQPCHDGTTCPARGSFDEHKDTNGDER